jgi:hypothetical protein
MIDVETTSRLAAALQVMAQWVEGIQRKRIKLPDGKEYFVIVPTVDGQAFELSPRLLKALNAEEVK